MGALLGFMAAVIASILIVGLTPSHAHLTPLALAGLALLAIYCAMKA